MHDDREAAIKTVNLKSDRPTVHEALQRLEQEIAAAHREQRPCLKIIHGYGSTGAGGDIRVAVQRRLCEMVESDQIRACIFGENWAKSDETAWKLLREQGELKRDRDLGRGNEGISIVVF